MAKKADGTQPHDNHEAYASQQAFDDLARRVGGMEQTLTQFMNAVNNPTIQNRDGFIPNREGVENMNFEKNIEYGSDDGEEEYEPCHQLVNRAGRNGGRDAGHGAGRGIVQPFKSITQKLWRLWTTQRIII